MCIRDSAYTEDVKIAFLPNVIGDSCAAAWAEGMQSYLNNFSNVTFDVYDGEASVAVSYTHLDVYKRQESMRT